MKEGGASQASRFAFSGLLFYADLVIGSGVYKVICDNKDELWRPVRLRSTIDDQLSED